MLIFGEQAPGKTYRDRPGAYCVIGREDGRIACAKTPSGRLWLPGGGIDTGETPEQAALRESQEEVGLTIAITGTLGTVIQYAYEKDTHIYWRKICTMMTARVIDLAPIEKPLDHELYWALPQEIKAHNTHGAVHWAVDQYLATKDAR